MYSENHRCLFYSQSVKTHMLNFLKARHTLNYPGCVLLFFGLERVKGQDLQFIVCWIPLRSPLFLPQPNLSLPCIYFLYCLSHYFIIVGLHFSSSFLEAGNHVLFIFTFPVVKHWGGERWWDVMKHQLSQRWTRFWIWVTRGMMMLYIEPPEVLVWGEDDEYNFGHDRICGVGRTLR